MINSLAVGVEGFGFSPLSMSTLGWLTELEVLPGVAVWYVPSDLIIRVGYEREHVVRQTYKVWPVMEKVVAKLEGSEAAIKFVEAKLVESRKILPLVRASKYE
jgi:hypothetical protein